jgi:hypothetical protein
VYLVNVVNLQDGILFWLTSSTLSKLMAKLFFLRRNYYQIPTICLVLSQICCTFGLIDPKRHILGFSQIGSESPKTERSACLSTRPIFSPSPVFTNVPRLVSRRPRPPDDNLVGSATPPITPSRLHLRPTGPVASRRLRLVAS